MKKIYKLIIGLKRIGLITRGIGLATCIYIVFYTAIPDLTFNITSKNIRSYTLEEIINSDKKTLPRYLKISDVQPDGTYVETIKVDKNGNRKLLTILYPLYRVDADGINTDEECYIIVDDYDVTEKSLPNYFNEDILIEGEYNHQYIPSEVKERLINSGYKINKNCILINKGKKPWSNNVCIIIIIFFGILGSIILLSILPKPLLNKIFKQEERFIKIKE